MTSRHDKEMMDKKSLTGRPYMFPVKIDSRTVNVQDQLTSGAVNTYQSRLVFLVPQVSSQSTLFFDAWLPALAYDDKGNRVYHEIGVRLPAPFDRVVRCAVSRKNKDYPEHHFLQLMSSETTEDMLMAALGKVIPIQVLPDSQELEIDA